MLVDLPERLAVELQNVRWDKVTERDLTALISIGVPFLKLKGYYKQKNEVEVGKFPKTSNSLRES